MLLMKFGISSGCMLIGYEFLSKSVTVFIDLNKISLLLKKEQVRLAKVLQWPLNFQTCKIKTAFLSSRA